MTDHDGKPSQTPWSEMCPWFLLLRTFRLAIGIRMLLLGAAGALLMVLGWAVLAALFAGTKEEAQAGQAQVLLPTGDIVVDTPAGQMLAGPAQAMCSEGVCPVQRLVDIVPNMPAWPGANTVCPLGQVGRQLANPFVEMLGPQASLTGLVFWLLCAVWAVAVWSVFGAGITRTAAVQLAAGEQIGLGALAGHVRRKWLSYLGAPLFPLLGVLLATIPMLCLGLLLRTGVTLWLTALVWPLLLAGGLLMAVLLLGLAVGWPLMWATISAEGKDAFDALSRMYAYVFQRPLHYLFYVVVAALLGLAGWILVSNFAALVIHMTYWAASWGSGQPRIEAILTGDESLGWGAGGAAVIRFWVGCVKLLAVGFLYSYFWTAATAIYFLLRRDTDATELDEVCLDEGAPTHYTLPPVGTDNRGAPVVKDEPPATEMPAAKTPPAGESGPASPDGQPE